MEHFYDMTIPLCLYVAYLLWQPLICILSLWFKSCPKWPVNGIM